MMSTRKKTVDDKLVLTFDELTSPFGLKRHLTPPRMKWDLVPVLDMIILALLISLFFTRYLILPGVRVDLPKTELLIQQDASRVAVLTIANSGMLFFDGSVYQQNSIEQAFHQYVGNSSSKAPVLLVEAGASMDIQKFLELCQMARNAGFHEVQIAFDYKFARHPDPIAFVIGAVAGSPLADALAEIPNEECNRLYAEIVEELADYHDDGGLAAPAPCHTLTATGDATSAMLF